MSEKYGLPDDMPEEMRMQFEGLPVMSEENAIMNALLSVADEMSDDDMPDDMRKQLEGFPVMSE